MEAKIVKETKPGMGTYYYWDCPKCGKFNLLGGFNSPTPGATRYCRDCHQPSVLVEEVATNKTNVREESNMKSITRDEAEHRFNHWLNDGESIQILMQIYSPSEVLQAVDPTFYEERLEQWLRDENLQIG